jgi:hypothetical protein
VFGGGATDAYTERFVADGPWRIRWATTGGELDIWLYDATALGRAAAERAALGPVLRHTEQTPTAGSAEGPRPGTFCLDISFGVRPAPGAARAAPRWEVTVEGVRAAA